MSEAATRERAVKRHWAEPGSRHDAVVRFTRLFLPAAGGVLLAFLLVSPLKRDDEASFILDKKDVDKAAERMRVEAARYTGHDDRGRPFLIRADQALQRSSDVPVVDITGMRAQLELDQGPATIAAPRGRYDLDTHKVAIPGDIRVAAPDGYKLVTSDVVVDMKKRTVVSGGPAAGEMKLGRFQAQRLAADIGEQRVVLDGGVRLKIVQGAVRR